MSEEVLVRAENVSKKFCRSLKRSLLYGLQDMATEIVGAAGHHQTLRDQEFWAVDNVSFELRRGECLGLIGHNGAGKTTLLKMLNGLIKPDTGRITMVGRTNALIALGAGFNPLLSGRENIYINGSILGLSKSQVDEKIADIIDFSEIADFIDSPVQSYSSGMHVRLGFAVATALNPDILILDEVLAVGDAAFRLKCLSRVAAMRRRSATIFVSHDTLQIANIASTVLLLNKGRVVETSSDVNAVLSAYELSASKLSAPANNKSRIVTDEAVVRLAINQQFVSTRDTVTVHPANGLTLTIVLPPADVPADSQHFEVRVVLLDRAESPILVIRERLDYPITISKDKLMHGVTVDLILPQLAVADGVYLLRLAVVGAGIDQRVLFFCPRLCGLHVSGLGQSWGKAFAAAKVVIRDYWGPIRSDG